MIILFRFSPPETGEDGGHEPASEGKVLDARKKADAQHRRETSVQRLGQVRSERVKTGHDFLDKERASKERSISWDKESAGG